MRKFKQNFKNWYIKIICCYVTCYLNQLNVKDTCCVLVFAIVMFYIRLCYTLYYVTDTCYSHLLHVTKLILQTRVTCCRFLSSCWTRPYTTRQWRTNPTSTASSPWTEASTTGVICLRTYLPWVAIHSCKK